MLIWHIHLSPYTRVWVLSTCNSHPPRVTITTQYIKRMAEERKGSILYIKQRLWLALFQYSQGIHMDIYSQNPQYFRIFPVNMRFNSWFDVSEAFPAWRVEALPLSESCAATSITQWNKGITNGITTMQSWLSPCENRLATLLLGNQWNYLSDFRNAVIPHFAGWSGCLGMARQFHLDRKSPCDSNELFSLLPTFSHLLGHMECKGTWKFSETFLDVCVVLIAKDAQNCICLKEICTYGLKRPWDSWRS